MSAEADAAAQSVFNALCEDPEVWATHGVPGEHKEALIVAAFAGAITAARENALARFETPSTEMMAAAEIVFEDWLVENSDVIRDNGGTGDTHSLFAALWASWKNAAAVREFKAKP